MKLVDACFAIHAAARDTKCWVGMNSAKRQSDAGIAMLDCLKFAADANCLKKTTEIPPADPRKLGY